MHIKFLIPISLAAAVSVFAQPAPTSKRPFTFEDMMALKRVAEPIPSRDGKWIVFSAEDVNLAENSKTSHLWIVAATGGEARRLNQTPNGEERPRFSPDGHRIIFTSKATDPTEIWMCDFDSNAGALIGHPHQLTNISTGADGALWSPDGKNIVFVSSVYPEAKTDAENKQRDEELKKSKVKAKIFSRLFYRHWNAYYEFKRSHLFVVDADGKNPARDLTPGDHDVPPFSLGGQDMYAISPDGQELAYTSNISEVEAISTNNEIFVVSINGGEARKISTSPGSDSTPLFSPDGKYIAWRSQARDGFEADRFALAVCDRMNGETRDATHNFDRSVGSFTWSPDSKTLFFSAEDHGESPIFALPLGASQPEEVSRLHADDLIFGANGNLCFTRMSIAAPNEIGRLDVSQKNAQPVAITHMNDVLLSQINMQSIQPFTFKGANNEEVQGFMIKPPGFDSNKKYPLKFLIHGGPQGAWSDSWTYRWNAELFAASGYVVVMINFHGSTGYGQKFTDSISGDWGGKPYVDLMKGLDYVEKTYPFIDKKREAAMGGSYGGYMANWLLGHTDRFKCFVSHDGTFNTESAYGTTEELWFIEWEFKGPLWKNRELYRKWSPHLWTEKFKTPTLVVHGQLDYRLDVSEGFQLFTALQRLKVPSKMLYFPDEGHWVLKPQNSQLWYKTVNDWVDQWTRPQ
jgi:dipeptidyl aminopeptidase/acylaminoacyl peptidase